MFTLDPMKDPAGLPAGGSYWKTKQGAYVPVRLMGDRHLRNAFLGIIRGYIRYVQQISVEAWSYAGDAPDGAADAAMGAAGEADHEAMEPSLTSVCSAFRRYPVSQLYDELCYRDMMRGINGELAINIKDDREPLQPEDLDINRFVDLLKCCPFCGQDGTYLSFDSNQWIRDERFARILCQLCDRTFYVTKPFQLPGEYHG